MQANLDTTEDKENKTKQNLIRGQKEWWPQIKI